MANNPTFDVDLNDDRLTAVKEAETTQLTEDAQLGQDLLDNSANMYDDAIAETNKWEQEQSQLQQERHDLTIEQIEQQKEQAQKDYTKEQAGAYVDWRKQSNQYGSEAEKMASAGLANTGFSESSQVSMYNAYQNRIAVARESFNQVWTEYNNQINNAILQNNAVLAEIATQAAQKRTEYIIQSTLHQEELLKYISDKKMETKRFYQTEYQTVLDLLNKEADRDWQSYEAELGREHDKDMADLNHKYDLERDRINNEFTEKMAAINHEYEIKLLNAKTEKEKELLKEQQKYDLEKLAQQQKYALEQLDKELANDKALAKYNYDLENKNNSYSFSGGGSSGITGGVGKIAKSVTSSAASTAASLVNKATSAVNKATAKTTQATLDSITALGYGPISAAKLNELVKQGVVEEYVKNGVTLFRKKATTPNRVLANYTQNAKSSVSLPTSKLKK